MEDLSVALAAQQQLKNLTNKATNLPQQSIAAINQLTTSQPLDPSVGPLNLHSSCLKSSFSMNMLQHQTVDDNSSSPRAENITTSAAPTNNAKNKKLFPQKLWDLINDDNYNFCLRWSDDGQLVYLNRDLFEDSYLKTNENQFHTQKAISFVRQMNMYGFRKVDDCYYENDNFKRDCEHLLRNMIRKHPAKNNHQNQQLQQRLQQPASSNSSSTQFLDDYCCGGNSNSQLEVGNSNHQHQHQHHNQHHQPVACSNLAAPTTVDQQLSVIGNDNASSALTSYKNGSSYENYLQDSQQAAAAIAERMQFLSNHSQKELHNPQNSVLNPLFNLHNNQQQANIFDHLKSFQQVIKASQHISPTNRMDENSVALINGNQNNNNNNNNKMTSGSPAFMLGSAPFIGRPGLDKNNKQQASLFGSSNSNDFNNLNLTNDDFNNTSEDIYTKSMKPTVYDQQQQRALFQALFTAQQQQQQQQQQANNSNMTHLNSLNHHNIINDKDLKSSINSSLPIEIQSLVEQGATKNNDSNLNNFIYSLLSSLNTTSSLYHTNKQPAEDQQQHQNLLVDFSSRYSSLQQICQALLAQQQQQHTVTSTPNCILNATYNNNDQYQQNDNCHNRNNNLPITQDNDDQDYTPTTNVNKPPTVESCYFEDCNSRRQQLNNENNSSTSFSVHNITSDTNNKLELDLSTNNTPTHRSNGFNSSNSSLSKNLNKEHEQNSPSSPNSINGRAENPDIPQQRKCVNQNGSLTNSRLVFAASTNRQRRENKPNRCFKRSIDSILDSNNCKTNNIYIDGIVCESKKIKPNSNDNVTAYDPTNDNFGEQTQQLLEENNYCINKCAKNLVTQVALAREVKLNSNVIEEASVFTKKFVSILFETAQVIARHSTNSSLLSNNNNNSNSQELSLLSPNSDQASANKIKGDDNVIKKGIAEDRKHDGPETSINCSDINLSDLSSAIKLLPSKLLKILK